MAAGQPAECLGCDGQLCRVALLSDTLLVPLVAHSSGLDEWRQHAACRGCGPNLFYADTESAAADLLVGD